MKKTTVNKIATICKKIQRLKLNREGLLSFDIEQKSEPVITCESFGESAVIETNQQTVTVQFSFMAKPDEVEAIRKELREGMKNEI